LGRPRFAGPRHRMRMGLGVVPRLRAGVGLGVRRMAREEQQEVDHEGGEVFHAGREGPRGSSLPDSESVALDSTATARGEPNSRWWPLRWRATPPRGPRPGTRPEPRKSPPAR